MGWNIHWTSEKGYIPVALKNHYDEKKMHDAYGGSAVS